MDGLTDRSRRLYRHANQLPFQIETRIVRLNAGQAEPRGAPTIRAKLTPYFDGRALRRGGFLSP